MELFITDGDGCPLGLLDIKEHDAKSVIDFISRARDSVFYKESINGWEEYGPDCEQERKMTNEIMQMVNHTFSGCEFKEVIFFDIDGCLTHTSLWKNTSLFVNQEEI